MSDDEDLFSTPRAVINDDIYERYSFDLNRDKSLPIHDVKVDIINTIKQNPVTILEGDTGCGKTTQVS